MWFMDIYETEAQNALITYTWSIYSFPCSTRLLTYSITMVLATYSGTPSRTGLNSPFLFGCTRYTVALVALGMMMLRVYSR